MSLSFTLLRRVRPAVWIFVGAFIVQFLIVDRIAASRHFLPDGDDMKFYCDWAQKLLGLQEWKPGEPNSPGTAYYGLPGYAYALAAIFAATGGYDPEVSPYVVALIQAVFHAGTATFLYLIACHVFRDGAGDHGKRGGRIGLAAAVVWTLFTPAQVFSTILMPTAWVVCAFWGVVYWLARVHSSGAASWWRPWLWMGLLIGVVAMLVASILMLLPLAVLAIALTVGKTRPFPRRIAAVVGAVSILMGAVYLGCAPAWIHNYFVAKDRVLLSAHDGLNFYLGNHATATGYTKIPAGLRESQEGLLEDSLIIPEKELGRKLKRWEVSAYWKEKGNTFIRENPVAWMRLLSIKFANFWNTYQYDDLSILKLLRDEGITLPGFRFGMVAAFAIPGIFLCFRRFPRSRWVVGAVLMLLIALMPVFVTERYRLAAVPGLILLGCGGVGILWHSLVSQRWVVIGIYAALLAGSVWFTLRTSVDIGTWSLDFYKAGIRNTDGAGEAIAAAEEARKNAEIASRSGDEESKRAFLNDAAQYRAAAPLFLARAQWSLETAYGYVHNNPHINSALGDVWFYRGDLDRARLCYESALRVSLPVMPHDGALNNLGMIAMVQKRWPDAEKYFLASLKFRPDDAKPWFNLARARKEMGNRAGAEEALLKAEQLRPDNPDVRAFRAELNALRP